MLKNIFIQNVRNIETCSFECGKYFNWFIGDNGAGKTSILEAISLLLTSKSFRSNSPSEYIRHRSCEMLISGEIVHLDDSIIRKKISKIGFKREIAKGAIVLLKRDGYRVRTSDFLSVTPPVQILAPDAAHAISSGPQHQRRFIDWGVFHVKHSYLEDWQNFSRILKQRNAALKLYPVDRRLIRSLSAEFVRLAMCVSNSRKAYWSTFVSYIKESENLHDLAHVLRSDGDFHPTSIALRYFQGWPENLSLDQALDDGFENDIKYKNSQYGPHRSSFDIKIDGLSASKTLSRGQIKILLYWLKLCQSEHLFDLKNKKTLFLVDDISSELDRDRRAWIYKRMQKSCVQVIGTGVELDTILKESCTEETLDMFHVKQGGVERIR